MSSSVFCSAFSRFVLVPLLLGSMVVLPRSPHLFQIVLQVLLFAGQSAGGIGSLFYFFSSRGEEGNLSRVLVQSSFELSDVGTGILRCQMALPIVLIGSLKCVQSSCEPGVAILDAAGLPDCF